MVEVIPKKSQDLFEMEKKKKVKKGKKERKEKKNN